jgi:branched-chain amino acid transport system ATP-binding protein/branched-chain amino acid transport system permease protein
MSETEVLAATAPARQTAQRFRVLWGAAGVLVLALLLPAGVNLYWIHIATLACIYWVLVAGLDLIVGYAGQLAIGFVGLLAIGAYTAAILGEKLGWPAFLALVAAGAAGGLFGFLVGLPSLRLRSFYFAMTTLGFATIVTQVALGWERLTGGGIGLPGPVFPAPLDTPVGFYYLALGMALFATYLLRNIAFSNFGRGLVAVRDAEVAAEAMGVPITRLKLVTFTLSGGLAGMAGALFAARQTYITPDAFTFDLSVLFFIAVLIGGRGRIIGPMIGTAILTLLPEIAAPLVMWSNFLYAVLLLLVVLLVPGGIAEFLERLFAKAPKGEGLEAPAPERLDRMLDRARPGRVLGVAGVALHFGGVRALDGVDLTVRPGTVHGLIGPNGSGKTTLLNAVSGFYPVNAGRLRFGDEDLAVQSSADRAALGIARTFQTPRVVGNLSVLENAMLGAYRHFSVSFPEVAVGSPRSGREDRVVRQRAADALAAVGLRRLAHLKAEQLQHTEQRYLEIARCLVMQPSILLLDEPAAGLSHDEIDHLRGLVEHIRSLGMSVLLVEHHADLVFQVSDEVTVLDVGRVLAHGTPAEVRVNPEVINAYLGA